MVTGEKCLDCGHADYDHGGGHCHWRQHGAVLACNCRVFVSPTVVAVAALPPEEQELLACANHLGIAPRRISRIETTTDEGGHFTGLKVSVHISTGRLVNEWVQANLPKEQGDWVLEYLRQRTSKAS